jgi:hypothetical protein
LLSLNLQSSHRPCKSAFKDDCHEINGDNPELHHQEISEGRRDRADVEPLPLETKDWPNGTLPDVTISSQDTLCMIEFVVALSQKRIKWIATISMVENPLIVLSVIHRKGIDAIIWRKDRAITKSCHLV